MDLTSARWHPSRFKHHFIHAHLCKLNEKHKPPIPITICSAFFLEELGRSERTLEIGLMLERDFEDHQMVIIPTRFTDDEVWTVYIIIRGQTLLERFSGNGGKENLVLIGIGEPRVGCENIILKLIYQMAKKPLGDSCPAYVYRIKDASEVHSRFAREDELRNSSLPYSEREAREWKEAWKVIDLVEAIMKDPTQTAWDILRMEGEVIKFDAASQ
ncbi:hypothetical protein ABW19_dt0209703 [Dactylella cylindrospora]|nr:hypothetical protein ABW19_dt0209703 [Dactylella cylindrospora]